MIKPMDCKEVKEIPREDNLIYERKYDGFRAIVTVDKNKQVKICHGDSPNVLNFRYPDLVKEFQVQPPGIYDGEICAFNEDGISIRQNVAKRQCKNRRKISIVTKKYPVSFMAFDLLKDKTGNSIKLDHLINRKIALQQQLKTTAKIASVSYEETPDNLLNKEGIIEGIVVKGLYSVYEEGKRTGAWRKKRFNQEETVKVVEYEEYTRNGTPAGITLITETGGRINLPGPRAEGARKAIDNDGYVMVEIEFYKKVENGYEFPRVKKNWEVKRVLSPEGL